MPEKTVAEFKIKYLQILDEKGNLDDKLEPKIDEKTLMKIYETMHLTRVFDEKANALQRTGRLATYASTLGQEAAQIASIAALEKEDFVFPSFRENGAYLYRGMPVHLLYLYWKGYEDGSKIPDKVNVFTISIPVGSQPLHAAGYGYAMRFKKQKKVSLVFFGDGATSEGEVYEAMNFAGVFKSQTIFFNQNNQWAISVPRKKQSKAETLAQKGIAAGINCIQVDGNDFLAVYKAVKDARIKALKGEPTIIEAITYRMAPHTTADDPKRYRNEKEVEAWKKKDPIKRMQLYLKYKGLWDEKYEKELTEKQKKFINEEAKKADELINIQPENIFNYVFKEMPYHLREQLDYLKENWRQKNA